MKKRKIFLSILFAFILCFSIKFVPVTNAFADSIFQITFDANGGTCETNASFTENDGKLLELPTDPTFNGKIFIGWFLNETQISTETVFEQDETVVAKWATPTNTYTISNNSTNFSVTGQTDDDNTTYNLGTDFSSLSNAILAISSDANPSNLITLNFNNLEANENLTLSFFNLTLTGSVSLGSNHIEYSALNSNSILNLTDLTINSTTALNQIEILGTQNLTMSVSNCRFNSTLSTKTYAIKFVNTKINLDFSNELIYTTNYVFNHETGIVTTINTNLDLTNQITEKFSITIGVNQDKNNVIENCNISKTFIELLPTESYYTCAVWKMNGKSVVAQTDIIFNFDANSGIISDEFTQNTSRFKTTTKYNFPSADDITKTHHTLDGYLAKITLDPSVVSMYSLSNSTFYFDKTMFEDFIQNSSNIEDIEDYFSTSIVTEDVSLFDGYIFDFEDKDPSFLAVKFLLENNNQPTFVAIWSETIYSISFNTNGGETQNDVTGKFETSVTLPTPTKTGYTFDYWCTDEDLLNEATITIMPDTYPTLYAKWTINSYVLSIYQNNGTSKIEKTIDYATTLSLIDEYNSSLIEKTGHTFDCWCTDVDLQTELDFEQMPANNLSIYAKWIVNSYTISLYKNHITDDSLFKEETINFGSSISSLINYPPVFEGYNFKGWFKDTFGQTAYVVEQNPTMPAENLTLYAAWSPINYSIKFMFGSSVISQKTDMHFQNTIIIPTPPSYPGYLFIDWFLDDEFTEPFTLTKMPSHDVVVYAKMQEKREISLNIESQSFEKSSTIKFHTGTGLNFVIEYFVDEKWTTTPPTKVGSYDVRLSRNEDSTYKQFSMTIQNGITITQNSIDVSVYILIFYAIAGIEIIISLVLLFLRKRSNSYISLAIALPFGLVSNSQFTHLIISLVLMIFGLVLAVVEYVKFHRTNNEVERKFLMQKKDNKYIPHDISENETISKKVDDFLLQRGFSKQIEPRIQTEESGFEDEQENLNENNFEDERENNFNQDETDN